VQAANLTLEGAMIAPPLLPPHTGLDDDDGIQRVHLRLWQLGWSSVVVLVTVWLMTLGWIPGIVAVLTAKHVLVAILVMGLGVNGPPPSKT
jgi:hypothetical protein